MAAAGTAGALSGGPGTSLSGRQANTVSFVVQKQTKWHLPWHLHGVGHNSYAETGLIFSLLGLYFRHILNFHVLSSLCIPSRGFFKTIFKLKS